MLKILKILIKFSYMRFAFPNKKKTINPEEMEKATGEVLKYYQSPSHKMKMTWL